MERRIRFSEVASNVLIGPDCVLIVLVRYVEDFGDI
jgi:hypothetical protein